MCPDRLHTRRLRLRRNFFPDVRAFSAVPSCRFFITTYPLPALPLFLLSFFVAFSFAQSAPTATEALDLSGPWRFALDREDVGAKEQWFSRSLPDQIQLPGVLQAQGYGDEINARTPWVLSLYDRLWYLRQPYVKYAAQVPAKVAFLSQPPRHYLGRAWYQRDIVVPEAWRGHRIVLFLERPRWETTVWIGNHRIGSQNSLVVPHAHDLGQLAPGPHSLTVSIDNRAVIPGYRPDAHAVSDSLGSTWNGVAGRIELQATPLVYIDSAQIFPDLSRKTARLKIALGNATGIVGHGEIVAGDVRHPISWGPGGLSTEIEIPLPPDARPWSEFDPALYRLKLELRGEKLYDRHELTYGIREIKTAGPQFRLNGRDIHLRGTHHGGDFPLTGYPAPDIAYWRKLFEICRAWGLNHMRFHSWCPPEAAFAAADEIGFYLQPECGMWNEINPGSEMEKVLYAETERMLKAYGNHPSFLLLSPSNEPDGEWKKSLPPWIAHFRAQDPRRLYTPGTGWSLINTPGPIADRVDFLAVHRIGPNRMRGQPGWFGRDYSAPMHGVDVPNIVHETGQWCAYPDFRVIEKFTGYLRPGNYEIARDSAEAKGLLARNAALALASGRFQLLSYKEEIEANLRTKELRGFQLLDLHDYLGQGTALVGLLDPFWEEKGYVAPAEFRRFCSETVPLARLTKRLFTPNDTFEVPVEIAHFGRDPLVDAQPYWRVLNHAGQAVVEGTWNKRTIPVGNGIRLGTVSLDLKQLPAPGAYRLVVGVRDAPAENDWNFWLYPNIGDAAAPPSVHVTRSWPDAQRKLAEGARVLFVPRTADLDWTCPPLDDVPIFWNRLMGPGWGRMLGLWCDVQHPALATFPTEAHADWQWASLMLRVRGINLDTLPRELQPIVQPIDDWNRNYKLGLLFECTVGPGKLMVSAVDLTERNESPVARQLRSSVLAYMASERFQPATAVTADALATPLFDTQLMKKLGAKAEGPSASAEQALDGNPNTYWSSHRRSRETRQSKAGPSPRTKHPHELTVTFPSTVAFSGLRLMPRQDHREHEGDIREYVVSISQDGSTWQELTRGELTTSFEPRTVDFGRTIEARAFKFTALSGFGPDPSATVAELAILYRGPPLPENTPDAAPSLTPTRSATPEIDEAVTRPAIR